jgi:hypothetical protein
MLEMTTESVIAIPAESFFYVTMSECSVCYSLQPCVSDATTYRCADWQACHTRQRENRQPTPVKLTDADVAGLLERMETQQADMERLKRIEAAAITWTQARDAWLHTCNIATCEHLDDASNVLMSVVKR